MNACLIGITGIPLGKHNVKDSRLDQADKLVEAKKKVYVQIDITAEDDAVNADAFIVTPDSRMELLFKDLEFVETRLERDPSPGEKTVLLKIKAALEADKLVSQAGLTAEEWKEVAIHAFVTQKPVVIAQPEDLEKFDEFLARVVTEAGYFSFLTVGGKENRAWIIKAGTTAVDAAGSIHTDMQKGFIRAEITSFADFIEAGGETEAKRAGKQRLETKLYVMQDYDLVNFRFNK